MEQKITKNIKKIYNHICNMGVSKNLSIFITVLFSTVLLLIFFALPQVLPKYSNHIFGGYQSFVIPYDAEIIDNQIYKKIVWIEDINIDDIDTYTFLAIKDPTTELVTIEKVFSYDEESREIITSPDGVIANRTSYDDIDGAYIKESSSLGIFYYYVSRPLGLIVMSVCFAGALAIGYIVFVKNEQ
ncbi:MAG: hypothetical protein RBR66_02360 [Candidatus Izemoplasmatales bacterium]|jgi:hypothetical protein|nr:hypothetical protein [Candidatus Izemoplasmatales bacterium]